jgi:hypothetical protein
MAWHEKSRITQLESPDLPIHGLMFLDGDLLAKLFGYKFLKGQKFPQITFPSGSEFEIWESGQPGNGVVHLFGEMDLSYRSDRNSAYNHANDIAEQVGYLARKVGDNQLEVIGHDDDEHYLITYDNAERRMVNIERPPQRVKEKPVHPAHNLMPAELAAKLPALYSTDGQGMQAVAHAKFFHPMSRWTWFITEYDPQERLCFGAVCGFEIELGLVSLDELESIGADGKTLKIERDLHFAPKTLEETLADHRRATGTDAP